jgi:hypothetical protein
VGMAGITGVLTRAMSPEPRARDGDVCRGVAVVLWTTRYVCMYVPVLPSCGSGLGLATTTAIPYTVK